MLSIKIQNNFVGSILKSFIIYISLIISIEYNQLHANSLAHKFFEDINSDIKLPEKYQPEYLIIGDENAPTTIIIYVSLTCKYCTDFFTTELPKLHEYIDKKLIKIHLILHIESIPDFISSMLIKCLGSKSKDLLVYSYIWLFQNQKKWMSITNENEIMDFVYNEVFSKFKISRDEFDVCRTNKETYDFLVLDAIFAGKIEKISMTPTFIIKTKTRTKTHAGIITAAELLQKIPSNNN